MGLPPAPQPDLESPSDGAGGDAQDLALVARIRAGESAAWSELIVRYQDRLFSVCLRMVHNRDMAADLTQDSFVKIIRGIDTFDGRAKFSTWVIRVTMNVCLSKLRSEKLRKHASLDTAPAGQDDNAGWRNRVGSSSLETREPFGDSEVQLREERTRVLKALSKLDPDQRAVLILADCQGLPYEQIAESLGVAVGTVKSRVFRARTALREIVEQLGRV